MGKWHYFPKKYLINFNSGDRNIRNILDSIQLINNLKITIPSKRSMLDMADRFINQVKSYANLDKGDIHFIFAADPESKITLEWLGQFRKNKLWANQTKNIKFQDGLLANCTYFAKNKQPINEWKETLLENLTKNQLNSNAFDNLNKFAGLIETNQQFPFIWIRNMDNEDHDLKEFLESNDHENDDDE